MSLEQLFGTGGDLTTLQMTARAVALFFIALVFVRITGMRAFGRKSSFDTILAFTLGALLSRVVVGASPAIPTIAATGAIVLLHRLIAMVTSAVPSLERLVKGHDTVLYRGGILDLEAMHRAGISRADLEEAVRAKGNRLKLSDVLEIHLESSGDLSVVEDVVGEARRMKTVTAS